jgi:hypothetical protein
MKTDEKKLISEMCKKRDGKKDILWIIFSSTKQEIMETKTKK